MVPVLREQLSSKEVRECMSGCIQYDMCETRGNARQAQPPLLGNGFLSEERTSECCISHVITFHTCDMSMQVDSE